MHMHSQTAIVLLLLTMMHHIDLIRIGVADNWPFVLKPSKVIYIDS
jgi:hypothetical protein